MPNGPLTDALSCANSSHKERLRPACGSCDVVGVNLRLEFVMPPAARITDMTVCPAVAPGPVPHVGGPIITGEPTVITCFQPQARISDKAMCAPGIPATIVKGSMTVIVGNKPAARIGDTTSHGGVIVSGCPTVLIGDMPAIPLLFVGKPCLKSAAAAGSPFVKA